MTFALCPDDGPPRLWRFVDPENYTFGWPATNVVSVLSPEQNILVINKPLFDQLGEMDKHMLLRTHARFEYV